MIDECANHLCHEIAQSFQILINIIYYFVDQILYLIMQYENTLCPNCLINSNIIHIIFLQQNIQKLRLTFNEIKPVISGA